MTLIISAATLAVMGMVLFHSQQMSFYDAQKSPNQLQLKRGDLAIISGEPEANIIVLPRAGYVMDVLRRPAGLIAAVYLPAMLISLYEVRCLANRHNYHSANQGRRIIRALAKGR